jgi:hypothetical protein
MAKKAAPRMTKRAAMVLAENSFFSGAGMEAVMKGRDYFLSPAARDFWLEKHAASVPIALKRKTANWEEDRKKVTPRARDLGRFAAEFSLKDALATGPVEVTEKHVRAASDKVSRDRRCHAASQKTLGGYCEDGG